MKAFQPTKGYESIQGNIDSGLAWKLEGSYGRTAVAAIENGDCVLGKLGHNNYSGGYVPSRYEVKSGTMGSIAYANNLRN